MALSFNVKFNHLARDFSRTDNSVAGCYYAQCYTKALINSPHQAEGK